LYAKYKKEQQDNKAIRADEWRKARNRKQKLLLNVSNNSQIKRRIIKSIKGAGIGKKVMYGSVSNTRKAEIEDIHKVYRRKKQKIFDRYGSCTWADWLRAQADKGDKEALTALRARVAAQPLQGNTFSRSSSPSSINASGQKHPPKFGRLSTEPPPRSRNKLVSLTQLETLKFEGRLPTKDSLTKKGTVIYRSGKAAIRDDGEKLKITRGADEAGLLEALSMAVNRYGERIKVTGTEQFKSRVVQVAATQKLALIFDDPLMESQRRELLISKQEISEVRFK